MRFWLNRDRMTLRFTTILRVFTSCRMIHGPLLLPKSLRACPKQPAANDTLGWILVKQGKFNEGLAYLRQAHALEFQQPEVRYHLAVALYGLGRNEEAKQELEAALATDKPFKEAEEARKLLAQIGSSQ